MKKYKMRIKDDKSEYDGYGICEGHDIGIGFVWLNHFMMYECGHYKDKENGHAFTMREIEKMPYGFVNQYDLIEVKEQLYYIKLPYINGEHCYINKRNYNGDISVSSKGESDSHKTKFTKQEIEEKFPFYANETCMVKVEDDE